MERSPPPPVGPPVFHDPTGRRRHGVRLGGALVAAAAVLLLIGFVASLIASPLISSPVGPRGPAVHLPSRKFVAARRELFAQIAADQRAALRPQPLDPTRISAAYFAPWEDAGLDSFQAHAGELTHVYPAWIELTRDGRGINTDYWNPSRNQATADVLKIARSKGVRIVPVVGNATDGVFDPVRVAAMLNDPAASAAVANQLIAFVTDYNFSGLQIDFERLEPDGLRKLAPWVAGLEARLHATGRELSITLEDELDNTNARRLAAVVDYAVLMAYDEHEDSSDPGPVASAAFVDRTLKRFTGLIGRQKLVLGVGAYGYDWTIGGKDATSITNQEAIALAAGYRDSERPQDVIDFDPNGLEPTFEYADEHGKAHEVWFLDAITTTNAMTLARSYGIHGAALWALGTEDPSMWRSFGRNALAQPDLHSIIFPQEVQFTGDGELLRVSRTPQPGARSYDRDPVTGLITDEDYTAYPSGWLVKRSGAPSKTVALTFDDGPDPTWTPKILDILKRRGVKATFFVIGENAANQPDLIRREYADGHEIGNHSFTHPNMGRSSEERVRLELTACQRAVEAILKRSITLFRPPYNADSQPHSYAELMPIAVAGRAGYVTAGESIDPQDWDTTPRGPDGKIHRLMGPEVVAASLANLDRGQSILLHDSGGDRSATVAALDPLITALQQRGYSFSTMGELEGRSRDFTMPALNAADLRLAHIDSLAFSIGHGFNVFVFWGFSAAIVLGLARIALMIGLASGRRQRAPETGERLVVDALVAAYNEAPVIAATIHSLLANRGVEVRVIVVDDGSTDGTAEVVERDFGDDPRVVLLRKPNGGKASALNVALAAATAPVVVGVDADTQLAPDALAALAKWFSDPAVGAVAGNVRVGNRRGIVTFWQSIEYVTSQNIDRRAMARLNAITVVPGAIGAWRTAALREIGGYRSDTLAEDMDLTWRVRRGGWTIANEPDALAYTEAPNTLRGLLRQRFRWTYGTLQCLWKHRAAVFRYGWFGKLSLPSLWLFQIAAQVLAPLVDLQLLLAVVLHVLKWMSTMQHTDISDPPDPMLWVIVAIYVGFLALEIAAGWVAYGFDKANRGALWLLPTQRFVYRQIMYAVVWRSVLRATGGVGHAWGKLVRTGGVKVDPPEPPPRPAKPVRSPPVPITESLDPG